MSLRHKLADWISGGELTRLLIKARSAKNDAAFFESVAENQYYRRRNALLNIIAQETPNANATVRRMAAIARAALTERARQEWAQDATGKPPDGQV